MKRTAIGLKRGKKEHTISCSQDLIQENISGVISSAKRMKKQQCA
jgi:hypothetical protein